MREIDRASSDQFGIPSLTLMENAASAVARAITERLGGSVSSRSILVLCGKGNNGGDGAATAHQLAIGGARVDLVLIGQFADTKGDAQTNFERARTWNEEQAANDAAVSAVTESGLLNFFECDSDKGWEQLLASVLIAPHDIIVDALLGTGLTRPVTGIHREAIRFINQLRESRESVKAERSTAIVAIDLPSGLDSDSEKFIGDAVRADLTVTMTAPKRANVLPPAAHLNGRLIIADIGSPPELISKAGTDLFVTDAGDARSWLIETRYTPESYKKTHGHALIVAGSRGFTGAAALCGNAAMRAGAGLVTVATPVSAQPLVATQVMPEVMTTALAETDRGAVSDEAIGHVAKFADRAYVLAIGPGLSSEDERTQTFVRALVNHRRSAVVIDADGLNCLSPWPEDLRGSEELPIVLTPHAGEMLRLLGTDDKSALDDRVKVARDFAVTHHVILVLKGSQTMIAAPHGQVFINSTGNAGLGTAGAGDTLTGVITGCLAQAHAYVVSAGKQRVTTVDTVLAAVYLSGLAGDLAAEEKGMRAMVASDIREHLSHAFRLVDPAGEIPFR